MRPARRYPLDDPGVPPHSEGVTLRGEHRRLGAAVVMVLLTLSAAPASGSAADLHYGVNPIISFSGPMSPYEVARLRIAGGTMMRIQLGWGRLRPEPKTPFYFGHYDDVIASAAASNVEVLGLLAGTPSWLPHNRSGWPATPTGLAQYRQYVTAVAGRYGRGGTFWKENPLLPYRPITTYEVWNEPNRTDMSPAGGGRPRAYARLLAITRTALNYYDEKALIVTGGVTERRRSSNQSGVRFLKRLYAVKGARDDFDIVGLHPYGPKGTDAVRITTDFRKALDDLDDPDTPIWITEIGWGSGGEVDRGNHPLVTSEGRQASLLTRSFEGLTAAAEQLRLGAILWYSFRDLRPFDSPGTWDSHAGLFSQSGRKKPAWDAFASIAGGRSGGDL